MFTPEQIEALNAPLSSSHVKEREQAGRKFSYVESWWAESEANRIFGFDGWSSETVEMRQVAEKPRKIGSASRDGWAVSYVAKVRVTVQGVVREGWGAGHGMDVDLGQAHESAVKEAESDAEKRALKTFGNPFGLALYDKTQANVEKAAPPPKAPPKALAPPAPAKLTLKQRADALEAALKASATADALNGTWSRGAGLCAELDTTDPERLAELQFLFNVLDLDLSRKAA